MEITAVIEKKSVLDVAEFNLNYLLKHIDDVKLAVLQDMEADCVVTRLTGKYLERREIRRDGVVVYHSGDIEFHDPPKEGSEGSAAKYYVWDDRTGILLQRIPPNSCTSHNLHKKGPERFYSIKGRCYICVCYYPDLSTEDIFYKGDISLNSINPPFVVEPYHCHQLHSLSDPAFNIILMPPGVGRSDHHFPKKCYKELTNMFSVMPAGDYAKQKTA